MLEKMVIPNNWVIWIVITLINKYFKGLKILISFLSDFNLIFLYKLVKEIINNVERIITQRTV